MQRLLLATTASMIVALVGCFQPTSTMGVSDCTGCRAAGSSGGVRKGAGAGSGSGTGSGGATSGGTGGSGGATAGGSSAGGTSGAAPDGGVSCPAVSLQARVYDVGGNTPIAGAQISALDQNGVPISGAEASSQADGTFTLCLPEGLEVTPEVQAAGYPTTYLANLYLTQSLNQFSGDNGIPMPSNSLLSTLAGLVSVGSIASQAMILVGVLSVSRMPPCLDNGTGWAIGLGLPDGGVLADGGGVPADLFYLGDADLPDSTLTATDANGLALFFNVDTSLTSVVSLQATNPDAGPCPVSLTSGMLTGRLYVAEGALTIALLPTP